MKKYLLALALLAAPLANVQAERSSTELASGWKFIKQDAAPDAAADAWESVQVPHTWNIVDGQQTRAQNPDQKYGYYRGACWYARKLDVPADWKGKRVFIRFEAASLVAKTYCNGELLGEHRGGFTAFCYELTPKLKFGGANEIRVRVDNSHQDDIAPLSGDFNIDGGLYRPVHLIVTDAACISPLDFASPGVYLTQKSLDKNAASIEARAMISNGSKAFAKMRIETEIKDADHHSVATLSNEREFAAGKTEPVTSTLTFPQPKLWQGRGNPYLYTATVRVIRDGKTVDEVSQPLGLRTFAISKENGFQLNDKKYPIYGVNRHQDKHDKGWALSAADHDEDAALLLELGVTAIRLAHYPQSEYFHDLCDRNGLLLWNEVSLVNTIRDTPEFAANAEMQLRELILQRYNHPSVAFWGLFNELGNEPMPPPETLLAHLKEVVKELDSSRLIVAASDHANKEYNQIADWTCFNSYPGWYGKGQPQDLKKYMDDRAKEIGKPIAMSEYGGGGNPFQHQEGAPQKIEQKGPYHPEEWQAYLHETEWGQIQNNANVWGSFVWVMFDFAVSSRNEGGTPALNDKGLVTQDRKVKKDVFYFYQANWSDKPMVYIASRRMTPRKQAATEVKVYSNCPAVELKINGKSLGNATPDVTHIARWKDVTLQQGPNRIEVAAQSQSGAVSDSCEWVLEQAAASTPEVKSEASPTP